MFFGPEPEPDDRPVGAVRFADPVTSAMSEMVHTSGAMDVDNVQGEQHGIRGIQRNWNSSGGGLKVDAWAETNRKKGVIDPDTEAE